MQFSNTASSCPGICHSYYRFNLLIWGHYINLTMFHYQLSYYCSLQEKIGVILLLTYQHARNLALWATFYKLSIMMSEKMMGGSNQLVTFLSAFGAGYFVFGTNNKLNMQVSIYCFNCYRDLCQWYVGNK